MFGERHDVEVVEEDPEDFARDVGDFAAPEAVRAGRAHVEDEVDGAVGKGLLGLAEVGEDAAGAVFEGFGWVVGCGGEEGD